MQLLTLALPFFIAVLFALWVGSCAPAPLPGRNCVLDRLQSLVSGPETSPRIKDEADSLIFISLLRAASTRGTSGGSSRLLPRVYALRMVRVALQQLLLFDDVRESVLFACTRRSCFFLSLSLSLLSIYVCAHEL